MSEHRLPPGRPTHVDIIDGLAKELEGRFTPTHGRFSLGDGDYVISEPRTGVRNRFLVVMDDQDAVHEALKEGGVAQFERSKQEGGISLYRLPVQVKPLAHERLFSGHVSSETYVSDQEVFSQLGHLWARIHAVTGQIPAENPMSHTALVDFEVASARLFPIPPYTDWEAVDSPEHAGELFINRLGAQLYEINPRESYRSLLNTAAHAWSEGIRADHE